MVEKDFIRSVKGDAERALFEGKLNGMVSLCFENERPLQGLGGLLDWRFHGALSLYIRKGIITGKKGECSYVPIRRHHRTFHLILIGAGHARSPGDRGEVPQVVYDVLRENLKKLNLEGLGLSSHDFGGIDEMTVSRKLEGVPIWLVQ